MEYYYVKNMYGMFGGCESLSSLPDISKWNTYNVTDMDVMFYLSSNMILSSVIKTKFK